MEIQAPCPPGEPFDLQAALVLPPQLEPNSLNPNLVALRRYTPNFKGTDFKLIAMP
jgi:hypothetical protein